MKGNQSFTLFLMTKKGFSVLHELVGKGYAGNIDKVIISHDKGVLNDYYAELYQECQKAGIPVFDRKDEVTIESAYCIAIGWRWLISLTDQISLIVCHDSLLPKYRGFAPLVNMLINKEPCLGVTALFASKEYDKGDIIDQEKIDVTYPIKIEEAIDMIAPLYSKLVLGIVEKVLEKGFLPAIPQSEIDSSYSLWRDEDDYRIDWTQSSCDVQQFIFSVGFPYKGASTMMGNVIVRVLDCELFDDVSIENRVPGKVIFIENNCPVVVCGKGLLKLTKVCSDDGISILPLNQFRVRFS